MTNAEKIFRESDELSFQAKEKVLQLELAVARIKAMVDEHIPELHERKRLEKRKFISHMAVCITVAIVMSVSITGAWLSLHDAADHTALADQIASLAARVVEVEASTSQPSHN